jgi:SfnB family sulfur acquisition oxidoreductase
MSTTAAPPDDLTVPADADQAVAVAARYAEAVADRVIERDRAGTVPVAELAALDASGLLGITVPAEHGGPELTVATLADVVRTIAAVDPAIAQVPQSHFLLVDVLAVWGSESQKRRLFADVLGGARFAATLAERGGRHAQDLGTRVHAGADGSVVLTGRKYYCTGAFTARWLGVSALDEDERQVLVFVPREAAGVTVHQDWNVMGQRATVSGTTHFEEVAVDPGLILPYQAAFEVPQQLGARAQLVHAAIQVGIAGGALRDARAFVRDRARPFFEAARAGWADTARDDPHTIHRFGRLATQVAAAEALLRSTADVLDGIGREPVDAPTAAEGSIAVARAKAFASEVAVSVSSDLFGLAGASAADERYDLSRHWRNARTHASHDPVDWKYHHVGNYLLGDNLPPNHGQL